MLNLFVVAAGRSNDVLAQLLLAGLDAPLPLHKGWSIHGGSLCLTVLLELWIADGLVQVEGGCGDLGWFGKCSPWFEQIIEANFFLSFLLGSH